MYTRLQFLSLVVLGCFALIGWTAGGNDPPKPLLAEERKELEKKLIESNRAGSQHYLAHNFEAAEKEFLKALDLARKLFGDGDHEEIVTSIRLVANAKLELQRFKEAEELNRDALAMAKRLAKGKDDLDLARSLENLGHTFYVIGRLSEAETCHREAYEMRLRIFPNRDHRDLVESFNNLGSVLGSLGFLDDAEKMLRAAIAMQRRLSWAFEGPLLADELNNLGVILFSRGKLPEAEQAHLEALAIQKRLFSKRDEPDMARTQNSLAAVFKMRGKFSQAETLYREALAIRERLAKGQDHPDVARTENNLGELFRTIGQYTQAELLHRKALETQQRLFKDQDHPDTARYLDNLAVALSQLERFAEAEAMERQAFNMRLRLYKGREHSDLAYNMNNLAIALAANGKVVEAEAMHLAAHDILSRLLQNRDHPLIAGNLNNLANMLHQTGRSAEAEKYMRAATQMYRRLGEARALLGSEGDTLSLVATFPLARDGLLSIARSLRSEPAQVYADIWSSKAWATRVYERRALLARTMAVDPIAGSQLEELREIRRRRAELLLAPRSGDPATRDKREGRIKEYDQRITELVNKLAAIDSVDKLANASVTDLQKALPMDAVFVDMLAYTLFEFDKDKPGKAGEKRTRRYTAFVVTHDALKWIDLGPAKPIENAIKLWQESITTFPYKIPADVPFSVRELVWAKLRKEFPSAAKVVYLSPDMALARIPWVAIPGDKQGSIVLEEFTVATVPHGQFLLDKLLTQPQPSNGKLSGKILVVGGVPYDEAAASPGLWTVLRGLSNPTRGEPLLSDGDKPYWKPLPGALTEAKGVVRLAEHNQVAAKLLTGVDTSCDTVLAELTGARVAHVATHGFFADPKFRSAFQVDPKLFEMRGNERVGAGANSPMVMSGLVFAGANKPETRGRGLITGEMLIDRDLSHLELAVLSACETGLGEVAGGEGVLGLQRAFHIAGCQNVIASLWKVDDVATAVLMNEFYRNLWEKKQSPVTALQNAQLEVYRADSKKFLAMANRGVAEGTTDLSQVPFKTFPPDPKGGNHPALWAAFSLSGPGR